MSLIKSPPAYHLRSFLPVLNWLSIYKITDFSKDLIGGIIAVILLVPEGIAYAMLAVLPAQVGLYDSLMLENVQFSLAVNSITLHFAEVKGLVMDKLQNIGFEKQLAPG